MLALLAAVALAAPERLAATFEVGTDVTDVTATADARYAAWVDHGGGMLTVLDLGSFDPITLSVCEGARGLAAYGDAASGWAFLVGCGDGKVARVDVDTGGEVKLAAVTYPAGSGAVLAVETDGETLWAIVEESGGVFTDWSGRATAFGGSAIATSALLASEVRALLGASQPLTHGTQP